jgi:MmeI, N-terminal domain
LNAVEIEQAVTDLAEPPFAAANFPYAFLEAFGNKDNDQTVARGCLDKSDLGGVLQTNNIHIATCESGQVPQTLKALRASPATAKAEARFVLATDGADFEAEDLPVAIPPPAPDGHDGHHHQLTMGCAMIHRLRLV